MKILKVDLPEYNINETPDYEKLGSIVDREIEKNFADGKYFIRAIGSSDHPQLTRQELIEKIKELGTDKYDSTRIAVAHESFKDYDYDIQAGSFEIKNGKLVEDPEDECKSLFGTTIYNFYVNTPHDRGYSVRIDLLMIYDPTKLSPAKKISNITDNFKPGLESFLYKFNEPARKQDSLLAIIEIT